MVANSDMTLSVRQLRQPINHHASPASSCSCRETVTLLEQIEMLRQEQGDLRRLTGRQVIQANDLFTYLHRGGKVADPVLRSRAAITK
nr:hypothetical protein CFP56_02711 [Quercus suber]